MKTIGKCQIFMFCLILISHFSLFLINRRESVAARWYNSLMCCLLGRTVANRFAPPTPRSWVYGRSLPHLDLNVGYATECCWKARDQDKTKVFKSIHFSLSDNTRGSIFEPEGLKMIFFSVQTNCNNEGSFLLQHISVPIERCNANSFADF